MPGLGQAMDPQGPAVTQQVGPAPQMEDAGPSPMGEAEANVSEAEQAEYDRILVNAMDILYPKGEGEGQVAPAVMEALQASDKPALSLATTAVSVVQGLRASAEKAGEVERYNAEAQQADDLDFDGVLFHIGSAVVSELAEIAEAAGIHEFSEEEVEQSFFMALDQYREQAKESGTLDEEGLKSQWGQLVEADQQGRLNEVLPGIEERARNMPAPEAEQAPEAEMG